MNNGKICVSVCARNAVELIDQVKQAEVVADVIEVRFDCLEEDPQFEFPESIRSEKSLLFTYRPKEQGGKTGAGSHERINFWKALGSAGSFDPKKDLIDIEFDLKSEISDFKLRKILSFHDFQTVPRNLERIAADLIDAGEIVKIAVRAEDATDALPVWKLLEKASSANQRLIPIALGEAGKWTRILGLAHGAPLTYASLNAGLETAPGQVSAKDLIELFRVRELDENTRVYGIIAGSTSYSMSPYVHNSAFRDHCLNSVFVPLQVRDLDKFMRRMVLEKTREVELNFSGFAVTNPHKQTIIKYLDELDETAKAIGAVNTIVIENGKLRGHNTDAEGFIVPLNTVYGELRGARAAVFGSGGAARACIWELKKQGAEITIFSRNNGAAQTLSDEFNIDIDIEPFPIRKSESLDFDVVINATPLGTRGELEGDTILEAGQIKDVKLVYDLVYNPLVTKLLREARAVHVPVVGGIAMLISQAAAQQKIWTGLEPPLKQMMAEILRRIPGEKD